MLSTRRLDLEPLRVEHAVEMFVVLDDVELHRFIGGAPATLDQLRRQYEVLAAGRSPDGSEIWLNWIVRRRDNGQAVGTIQATVTGDDGRMSADIAWVIGAAHQRRGFAREATQAMVDCLRGQQVESVTAYVHPEHEASMALARAIGLVPTTTIVDGEVAWLG